MAVLVVVVSLDEFFLFITSKIADFFSKNAEVLHRAIDSTRNGLISFSEFESYLNPLKSVE